MGGRMLASTAAPVGRGVPLPGSRPRSLRLFHLPRPPFESRLPLVLVGTERLVAGLRRICAGVGDTTGACVGEAGALFVTAFRRRYLEQQRLPISSRVR